MDDFADKLRALATVIESAIQTKKDADRIVADQKASERFKVESYTRQALTDLSREERASDSVTHDAIKKCQATKDELAQWYDDYFDKLEYGGSPRDEHRQEALYQLGYEIEAMNSLIDLMQAIVDRN